MKPSLSVSLTALASIAAASSLSGEVAVYWGQASSMPTLQETCSDSNIDIVILSFLNQYPSPMSVNLWPEECYPDTSSGSWSYTCDGTDGHADIETGIKYCQSKGIKVFLSIGGSSSGSVLTSDEQGTEFADSLWKYFGPVTDSSMVRPFGDAVLDGFDFDIEGGSSTGLVATATELRAKFDTDSSKKYYLSAAPQCPENDAYLGTLLNNADIDYAFIQFYNNYCSLTGSSFNWDWWASWALTESHNKNIKLLLGLPGSIAAAPAGGYVSPTTVESALDNDVEPSSANFGGIMIWNAYYGSANTIDGVSFIDSVAKLLGDPLTTSSSTTSSSTDTSSTSTTSTSTTSDTTDTSKQATSDSTTTTPAPLSTEASTSSSTTTTSKDISSSADTVNTNSIDPTNTGSPSSSDSSTTTSDKTNTVNASATNTNANAAETVNSSAADASEATDLTNPDSSSASSSDSGSIVSGVVDPKSPSATSNLAASTVVYGSLDPADSTKSIDSSAGTIIVPSSGASSPSASNSQVVYSTAYVFPSATHHSHTSAGDSTLATVTKDSTSAVSTKASSNVTKSSPLVVSSSSTIQHWSNGTTSTTHSSPTGLQEFKGQANINNMSEYIIMMMAVLSLIIV